MITSPGNQPPRPLDYGKPETPMPAAVQWALGSALALVVVTVVGLLFTASQGPLPGVFGALTTSAVLVRWSVRLNRGGYYRPMATAVGAGAAAAVAVVVACVLLIARG